MKNHHLIIASAIICIACTPSINFVEKNHGNWYGPASCAFDDYIDYYCCLPSDLSELDAFILMRDEELDDDRYCFGDVKSLHEEFQTRKVLYYSASDSCYYCSRRYNKTRECLKLYSPQYYYSHPDFAIENLKNQNRWTEPMFFTDGNVRCCQELTSEFMSLLQTIQSEYSGALVKPWKYRQSIYHNSYLFEFSDNDLKLISCSPSPDDVVYMDRQGNIKPIPAEFENSPESLGEAYLQVLLSSLEEFVRKYGNIRKVIFVSPILL